MDNKNLSSVRNRITIPSNGGLVTIETGGETEYINKKDLANELYDAMDLGSASKKDTGTLVGNIPTLIDDVQGNGVSMFYSGQGMRVENINTAFNKNFGGNGSLSTVARSDHSHNEIINNMSYIFSDIITLASGATSIRYNSDDIKAQAPLGTSYINPNISVTVYNVTSNTTMRNMVLNGSDVQVTMAYNSYTSHKTYSLDTVLINNLTASKKYMIMIEFSPNILSIHDVIPT